MTEQEIELLIQRAAEEGAKQALREVGLNDEDAFSDVRELRGLLDSWHETKRTIGQTVTKALTTVILTLIAASIWFNYGEK